MKTIFIAYVKNGIEQYEILIYIDGEEIKEYLTNITIPKNLCYGGLFEASKEKIKNYETKNVGEIKEVLDNVNPSKINKLRDAKIRLLAKTHSIYKISLRVLDKEKNIEEFKKPISYLERRFTSIPGQECSKKENLPLFKHTTKVLPILVYQGINGKFKELLTGTTITSIREIKNEDLKESIYTITQLGQSGSSFIRLEELSEASIEEIEEYQRHNKEKLKKLLSEIFNHAEEAYKFVIKNLQNKKQEKRKQLISGGFINT